MSRRSTLKAPEPGTAVHHEPPCTRGLTPPPPLSPIRRQHSDDDPEDPAQRPRLPDGGPPLPLQALHLRDAPELRRKFRWESLASRHRRPGSPRPDGLPVSLWHRLKRRPQQRRGLDSLLHDSQRHAEPGGGGPHEPHAEWGRGARDHGGDASRPGHERAHLCLVEHRGRCMECPPGGHQEQEPRGRKFRLLRGGPHGILLHPGGMQPCHELHGAGELQSGRELQV